ncbi:MAG: histidine kinase [Saprospiraceae bacterium]|nr:histidine kinase [Saprospiraceae bacterium]
MGQSAKNILGHFAFWVIIMFAYAISEFGYTSNFRTALLFELAYLPSRLLAVYFNWFFLIPHLLYRDRILSYLISLGVFLFLIAIVQRYLLIQYIYPVLFSEWANNSSAESIFFRIFQSVVVIASPVAFSTGIKIFSDWYLQRSREKKLEKEKIETELKYLKAQINPHFLFNTLNNLYGLSSEKSERVPELILKLSDFLSYSLYESQQKEESSLVKEMNLVKDYVQLETSRYEERVKVIWEVDYLNTKEMTVPSFLFIPLVENAFKHGVREALKQTEIKITLKCTLTAIKFEVTNSLIRAPTTHDDTGGIGLQNLRRRLDLLIPGQYRLSTMIIGSTFHASLKIDIHAKKI